MDALLYIQMNKTKKIYLSKDFDASPEADTGSMRMTYQTDTESKMLQ